MAELVEFSNILVLKDTPVTRYFFGAPMDNHTSQSVLSNTLSTNNPHYNRLRFPEVGPNGTQTPGAKFHGGNPPESINDSWWSTNNIFSSALLNSIGVEESDILGWNKTPVSSGTAIIDDNKLYIGATIEVNYTSITTGTEVTISGTGFTGNVNTGDKVVLSNIGSTNLSVSTTYYAHTVTNTSFKLATSFANAESATNFSATGSATSGKASIAKAGYVFNSPTSFQIPSTPLAQGDYIFWGDDSNNLSIGGKIDKVYVDGVDPEYADGARYLFVKDTAFQFPNYGTGPYNNTPVPQEIYYYRKNWNGKGTSNTISTGFYVLIGIEKDSQNKRAYWPFLDTFGANDGKGSVERIIDTSTTEKYAHTDLLRVRRISEKYESDQTYDSSIQSQEIIPCTIYRTNGFWFNSPDNFETINNENLLTSLFTTTGGEQAPAWCAYYVNPYGLTSQKLGKNTTYVIEINERLPAFYRQVEYKDKPFFNLAVTAAI